MEHNDPLHHHHHHHHHHGDLHHYPAATGDDDDEALIAAAMDATDDQGNEDLMDRHHYQQQHLLEPIPFEPINDTHTNGYPYHNKQEEYYRQTNSDTPGSNQKGVKISRPRTTVHLTRTTDTPEAAVERTTTWDVLSGKMTGFFFL